MDKKIKVSWLIGRQEWAYKNLASHNTKAMPEHEHELNGKRADVFIGMYPLSLQEVQERKKAIIHLDSRRILGL